jgi:hypothetical protein
MHVTKKRAVPDAACHMIVLVYYKTLLQRFSRIVIELSKIRPLSSLRVVVNNSAINDQEVGNLFAGAARSLIVLRHDNDGLEFGGYQRGVDDLASHSSGRYEIIFANDTFGSHQPTNKFFLKHFDQLLNADPQGIFIAGRIDHAIRSMTVGGFRVSRWVRANLFAVDHLAMTELRNQIYEPKLNSLITNTPDVNEFFAKDICPVLKSHLAHDLFNGGWDRSQALSESNYVRMADKARSIIQEFYLAARLDNTNAAFLCPRHLSKMERLICLNPWGRF